MSGNRSAYVAGESKLYAISDNPDICMGLALAGISCQPAHTPGELCQALINLPPDIGIVIITSGLAAVCADVLEEYRERSALPLVVIIPEMSE
ncbi:MAG: V-type ATP synthase subunit F [Defluviitaleaceae bacterium]|nr:V-type ATP synthase subunit F [Defluviitaleaceae bacterium]